MHASQSVEVIRSQSSLAAGIINAQTFGMDENAGNAGTVRLTTEKLSINGGGQIATSTSGAGDGGTLSVDASETIEVSGRSENGAFPSSLFAQSSGSEATGNAGMLKIDTRQLIVGNGARISVGAVNGSVGQGES